MTRILIVDDDQSTLASIARTFRLAGHEAIVCDSAARALALLRGERFDIIFSDVVMPGKDGLSMLAELRGGGIGTPIIMISGQATVDMAVRATRLGALDFLEKPVSADKLLLTLENALKLVRLEEENKALRRRVGRHEIVWKSDVLRRVMAQVNRVAATESRVCILGETGTGKELVARAVHHLSKRKDKPLIKLNCSALPTGLIESELFGHEKGAFTGALEKRIGRFALADGGTIFLDEIGDIPPDVQLRLLRVLQEHEFEPVGAARTMKVDVRVIAATNRDLARAVADGSFRVDLFYRLNVFPIPMPPLRERRGDIPLLVHYFIDKYAVKIGRPVNAVSNDTMQRLLRYSWPGNIRELENVIERAMILSAGPALEVGPQLLGLPEGENGDGGARAAHAMKPDAKPEGDDAPGAPTLDEAQRRHILRTLQQCDWVVDGPRGAARVLGLNPNTLRSRMKKLGVRRSNEGSRG